MHRNFTNLVFVIGLLILVTACVCRSDRDQDPKPATQQNTSSNTGGAPANQANSSKIDEGDFIVEQIKVTDAKFVEIDAQVRSEKLLEKAATRLNDALILPNDIHLRTKVCGEVNAYYEASDQSITVCYEMMEHFYKVFRGDGNPDEKAYDKMFDAVRFVFLHEVGHPLIDTYKLPIAGNEEDAADRCSAYINLEELGQDGVDAVFAAAEAFQIESKLSPNKARDLSDEHLLQEQRFYNSLCMIYGSNSVKYKAIVSNGFLPKERAVRCENEYTRTVDSWKNLIAPWRKTK